MVQAFTHIRSICFLIATLSLCTVTLKANAGVRIVMDDGLEAGRHFLVTTTLFNRGFDSFSTDKLDSSFLTSGEKKDITVLATIPVIYDRVSAIATHPCYYGDGTRSNKMPFVLRTVILPTLRPLNWQYLLASDAPIPIGKKNKAEVSKKLVDGAPLPIGVNNYGISITPSIINEHFRDILHHYLPAFDRAGIQEDLQQYIPLLNEMAAFAHSEQAYENRMATMNRIFHKPSKKHVESLKKNVKRDRIELDRGLDEIKAWLALEQSKRTRIHNWMDQFHKAGYVYQEMMTHSDHKRIQQWLEAKSLNHTKERKLQWTNRETGLHYILYPKGRHGGKSGSGYSTDLIIDLNPILGLENNWRYQKKNHPYFYRKTGEKIWKVK